MLSPARVLRVPSDTWRWDTARGNLPNCFCGKYWHFHPSHPPSQLASPHTFPSSFSLCMTRAYAPIIKPLHEWMDPCLLLLLAGGRAGWRRTNKMGDRETRISAPLPSSLSAESKKLKPDSASRFFRSLAFAFSFSFRFRVFGPWIVGVCARKIGLDEKSAGTKSCYVIPS